MRVFSMFVIALLPGFGVASVSAQETTQAFRMAQTMGALMWCKNHQTSSPRDKIKYSVAISTVKKELQRQTAAAKIPEQDVLPVVNRVAESGNFRKRNLNREECEKIEKLVRTGQY